MEKTAVYQSDTSLKAPRETIYTPRPELRPWISEVRTAESAPGQTYVLRHPPTGESGLLFRLHSDGAADLSARGPFTHACYKSVSAVPFYIWVVIRPGRARDFFGVPLDELTDGFVPVPELWGIVGNDVRNRLLAAAGNAVSVAEESLLDILRSRGASACPTPVERAIRALQLQSSRSLQSMQQASGLSGRQLRRLFLSQVGMSPKAFARITRIRHLLELTGPHPSWANLALDAGFYDQSHLINEFEDLMGETPTIFSSGWIPTPVIHCVISNCAL